MMQFEYDPERLIMEVSKRPGIWNNEDPQYRAKTLKPKLWHDIVVELVNLNEATLSKSEMRELELQLQKKWKCLRDSFQKYLMNPNKFKRPYTYAKQLQFMLKGKDLPTTQRKRSNSEARSNESGEDEDSAPTTTRRKNVWVLKPKKQLKIQKKELVASDEENDTGDEYTIEPNITTENEPTEGPGQFAFANVEIKPDPEDSDKMFLMSLLPHLRSIPEEFRLNVKLELMQVLRVANDSTAKLKHSFSNLD